MSKRKLALYKSFGYIRTYADLYLDTNLDTFYGEISKYLYLDTFFESILKVSVSRYIL